MPDGPTTTGATTVPGHIKFADPRDYITAELAKGSRHITVPQGTYRLEQKGPVFLTLRDLADTVIDCTGVTFIGLATTTMLELVNCRDVQIKGLAVDYDPLPFTQGVITSVDTDGAWDVKIIEGYPTEGVRTNADVEMRIQVYDPVTGSLVNPLRHDVGITILRTGDRRFRIIGGRDRSGKIGDIAVFNVFSVKPEYGSKNGAILTNGCSNLVFEDIVIRSSAFMGFVSQGDSATSYLRCILDRCPPGDDYTPRGMKRLRSLNVDGFHIKNSIIGPRITDCTARYMADDCVNISGMYSLVTSSQGNEMRIISSFYEDPDMHPGETLEIMAFDGSRIPDAKIVSIRENGRITPEESAAVGKLLLVPFYQDPGSAQMKKAYRLVLDRAVDLKLGDVVISGDRVGNGFVIEGNTFGPIRSRPVLIKASHGVIANNTITGAGPDGVEGAIRIGPEYYWMEGSCGSDILIENNTIKDSAAPAIYVGGFLGRLGSLMPANSRSGIRIINNTITNIPAPGIVIRGCTGLTIENNKLFLRENGNQSAMDLKNVESLTDQGNTAKFMERD